jgi:hypothetical protein
LLPGGMQKFMKGTILTLLAHLMTMYHAISNDHFVDHSKDEAKARREVMLKKFINDYL